MQQIGLLPSLTENYTDVKETTRYMLKILKVFCTGQHSVFASIRLALEAKVYA